MLAARACDALLHEPTHGSQRDQMVGVVEQRKVHFRAGKDLHRITAQTLEHRRNPYDTSNPDGDRRIR